MACFMLRLQIFLRSGIIKKNQLNQIWAYLAQGSYWSDMNCN
jgi:hypothetical protein